MWCYIGILAIDSPIYTLYYFLHNTLGISTLPLWIWKLNQLGRSLCSFSVHFSDLDYSCVLFPSRNTQTACIYIENFLFFFSGDDYILFFNHLSFLYYYYYYLLYNIVLVLPYINRNLPQVYTCSPSWTPLPTPSLYHPAGSSQCTSPKHPVSCIEPGLGIRFLYDIIHVSMPFSQIIPPSSSPTESKRLFYTFHETF